MLLIRTAHKVVSNPMYQIELNLSNQNNKELRVYKLYFIELNLFNYLI